MMGTEWFPETLCFLSELTRLTAWEDFINIYAALIWHQVSSTEAKSWRSQI
jgi:hypothetical protein